MKFVYQSKSRAVLARAPTDSTGIPKSAVKYTNIMGINLFLVYNHGSDTSIIQEPNDVD